MPSQITHLFEESCDRRTHSTGVKETITAVNRRILHELYCCLKNRLLSKSVQIIEIYYRYIECNREKERITNLCDDDDCNSKASHNIYKSFWYFVSAHKCENNDNAENFDDSNSHWPSFPKLQSHFAVSQYQKWYENNWDENNHRDSNNVWNQLDVMHYWDVRTKW